MFSLGLYEDLLKKINLSTTNDEKGKTFEDAAEYILSNLNGITIYERDLKLSSEEIDFVLYNSKIQSPFNNWDDVILVECKNWSCPVGAKDLAWFITKLKLRGIKNGIFIAANGITGSFIDGDDAFSIGAANILFHHLSEIKVIIITRQDMNKIQTPEDFYSLATNRYVGIHMRRPLA